MDPSTLVTITRQPGDWRKLDVRFDVLDGWRLDTLTGGIQRRTVHPTLFAYMNCEAIPDGVEFGHSCLHGPAPHRIKVIVQKVDNKAIYADLLGRARP